MKNLMRNSSMKKTQHGAWCGLVNLFSKKQSICYKEVH
jgi:hypothetical protein